MFPYLLNSGVTCIYSSKNANQGRLLQSGKTLLGNGSFEEKLKCGKMEESLKGITSGGSFRNPNRGIGMILAQSLRGLVCQEQKSFEKTWARVKP